MVGYEAMRRKLNTPFDIIRTTFKERGVLGLWRGTGVTVMRDSLGCGGFFVMNELGKRVFGPYLGGRDSKSTFLLSGACAGWGVSFEIVITYGLLDFVFSCCICVVVVDIHFFFSLNILLVLVVCASA